MVRIISCFLCWGVLLLSLNSFSAKRVKFPPLLPIPENSQSEQSNQNNQSDQNAQGSQNNQKSQYPNQNYSKLWHFDAIGLEEAWKYTKGIPSTIIAVVDSGVTYNDPDLRPALFMNPKEVAFNGIDDDANGFVDDVFGWNFNEGGDLPFDDNGHGTFISSLLVAQGVNAKGGKGVCPQCSLMSLRFLDKDGAGDDADMVKSVRFAVHLGAKVMNISTAGEGSDASLLKALKEAQAQDVFVVVAAGNDGESNDKSHMYPANYNLDNMITVGSTSKKGLWWKYSNYSPTKVHIAAPGEDLWGAWTDGKWYTGSGTSFSAPIVAAVAGLIRSADPSLTAPMVKQILLNTVTENPEFKSKCVSSGIVHAGRAVACAKDPNHSCLNIAN